MNSPGVDGRTAAMAAGSYNNQAFPEAILQSPLDTRFAELSDALDNLHKATLRLEDRTQAGRCVGPPVTGNLGNKPQVAEVVCAIEEKVRTIRHFVEDLNNRINTVTNELRI